MSVLVLGGGGQLGRALARRGACAVGRDVVDVTRPTTIAAALARRRPSLVVNAAALTAVDACEVRRAEAFAVNGVGAGNVARACAAFDVPLLHVSTDYVFGGGGGAPFEPDADPSPMQVYGDSKLAGERAVRGAGGRWAIVRTAWLFGPSRRGFVAGVLGASADPRGLRVVEAWGNPTPVDGLAETLLALAESAPWGRAWHAAGDWEATWADLAEAVLAATGRRAPVGRVPPGARPAPARRPVDTRLDVRATVARVGSRIDARAAVRAYAEGWR